MFLAKVLGDGGTLGADAVDELKPAVRTAPAAQVLSGDPILASTVLGVSFVRADGSKAPLRADRKPRESHRVGGGQTKPKHA